MPDIIEHVSDKTIDKNIYKINQVASFFAHQSFDEAVAATATHIRQFWDPAMRTAVGNYIHAQEKSGKIDNLLPVARQAILSLNEK